MRALDRPAELGLHLEGRVAAWREILGGVDASALLVFARLDVLALAWAALQREILSPYSITYSELSTIGILRTAQPEPRCSPTELRRLVGQSSAGMTRILDKLEAEGIVRREYQEDDRRRVDVLLTPSGAALAEESFQALLALESALLAPLGKPRRDAIASSFDALLDAFAAPPK